MRRSFVVHNYLYNFSWVWKKNNPEYGIKIDRKITISFIK